MRRARVAPLALLIHLGLVACAVAASSSGRSWAHDPAARIAAEVDSLRIVETIRHLSQDSTGAPISRYAERTATRGTYAPMVRDLFASFLASPDTVFFAPFSSIRTDTPQVNVVGLRHAQTATSAGLVLLTGHLDTTGRRTIGGWRPLEDPAPGADDNASGVAYVAEGARLLTCGNPPCDTPVSGGPPVPPLPFDLGFVAFGAEEAFGPTSSAPLEGSRVFARALTDSGVPILAVFNCDMIAYNPGRKKIDIVTNAASEWIADLILDTAPSVAPDLMVKKVLTETTFNSDHASFWNVGDDAITAIENRFPDTVDSAGGEVLYPANPHYHTTHDTLGSLNIPMAADVTRLILASVARLAVPPDGPPDLYFDGPHILVTTPRMVFTGDDARVEVRVFNRGGAMSGSANGVARVELWRGDPESGGRRIGEETVPLPIAPWFYKTAVFDWRVPDADAGNEPLVARVSTSDISEATLTNNVAERSVPVFRNAIANLRAWPNPMRLSRNPAALRFEYDAPLRPGAAQDIEAVVFDTAGREVARHPRVAQDGISSRYLLWNEFRSSVGDPLPSGIYFVEVRLIDRATGATVSQLSGKFTLLR